MNWDLLISLAKTEQEANYYRMKKKEQEDYFNNLTYEPQSEE